MIKNAVPLKFRKSVYANYIISVLIFLFFLFTDSQFYIAWVVTVGPLMNVAIIQYLWFLSRINRVKSSHVIVLLPGFFISISLALHYILMKVGYVPLIYGLFGQA